MHTGTDGDDESILDLADQTMRPTDNAVQQQRIEAWHPVLDPELVIYAFLVLAVIFIPTGKSNSWRVDIGGIASLRLTTLTFSALSSCHHFLRCLKVCK